MASAASAAAPANDNFAAAQLLSGTSGSVTGTNVDATKELGEPNPAGNIGGASVWYTWVAPVTGQATFATEGSSFDTIMGAYTGTSVSTLTELASNDDVSESATSWDWTSSVTFTAIAGNTYRIVVDGYHGSISGQAMGSIQLGWSLSPTPPPANDNFASAQLLNSQSGNATVSNIGATKEPGEPNPAGNIGGASVWYTWVAPVTGQATFATEGSSFDTIMGAYTGTSVSALTELASNDDVSDTDLTSSITFTAIAGNTYRITVDGYHGVISGQAAGTIQLGWSTSPASPPANDNFVNAQLLSGTSGSVAGTNVAATKEPGEPNPAGNVGGASVWYTWTAPASGQATFATEGSSFDSIMGAYTGTSVSALTELASNDDVGGGDLTSSVTFTANAGTTYRIAVDGYHGSISGQAAGNIQLGWTFLAASLSSTSSGGSSGGGSSSSSDPPVATVDQQVMAIAAMIDSYGLDKQFASQLKRWLERVEKQAEKKRGGQACLMLAQFVRQVQIEAQKKRSILTPAQAASLLAAASRLGATLGCR